MGHISAAAMLRFVLAAALVLPLAACGGDAADDFEGEVEETNTGVLGRMSQMQEAAEQMQAAAERPPAEPVNFRVLRDLLPESVNGMERTAAEGATQAGMGFAISQAQGTYESEGSEIDIQIMDYGAVPQIGMMGFGWAFTDMDRESGAEYERTVQLGESKGYRKYNSETRNGEFSLLVAERFVVQVEGSGVDDAALEAALRAVDLRALAGMRDEGRPDA